MSGIFLTFNMLVVLLMAAPLHASVRGSGVEKAQDSPWTLPDSGAVSDEGPVFLAQAEGEGQKKVRKRRLSAEGKVNRSGDKTTIDFESVDIVGSRRTPLGSMINQSRAAKDYDFVKVRLRWHPEMINSASSLDTGD